MSLYTWRSDDVDEFKARQPHFETGKGCINLVPSDTLPTDDIGRVIRRALTRGSGD